MSVTSNQIVSIWEVVESKIRRCRSMRNGLELTASQQEVYADALVLTVLTWHDKCSFLEGYTTNWIDRWVASAIKIDVHDLVCFLKDADALLLDSIQNTELTSYDGFKHRLRIHYPFSGDILFPLRRVVERWLAQARPDDLDALHTCFAFLGRLSLPDLVDLQGEARVDYVKREETLKSSGFTTEEEEVFKHWFPMSCKDALYQGFDAKHGPGASADVPVEGGAAKRGLNQKYLQLGTDPRLRYLDLRLEGKTDLTLYGLSREQRTSRVNKIIFVPKSATKLRTISMEPVTLMWYQKGFANALRSMLKEHAYLRRRISLSHQEYSRRLAKIGSYHGSYATIDLSAASDSVSWAMVQQWIRHTPLFAILFLTRSTSWRLSKNGSSRRMAKFAPMGSDLCFPTECLVFAAIVECSINEQTGGRAWAFTWLVYGDDIIVPVQFAAGVIARLEQNGFKVNTSKTFCSVGLHNFRESCGGEYYDGVDVTPLRIPRNFAGYRKLGRFTPSRIESLIQMCNDYYEVLPSVRRRIIASLLAMDEDLRPLFVEEKGLCGIYSPQSTNFHLQSSWNSDLQKPEYIHGETKLVYIPGKSRDAELKYLETLRLIEGRERLLLPGDTVSVKITPLFRSVWVRSNSDRPTFKLLYKEVEDLEEMGRG